MKRFLYVSDVHIPYDDTGAVNKLMAAISKDKFDTIILGGDIIDFYKTSSFSKDPLTPHSLQSEIDHTLIFFNELRRVAGKKVKIYWLEGNHEERLTKYLRRNASELIGLRSLEMEALFNLDRFNIRYVKDTEVLAIDNWVFRHGHEMGSGSIVPGNNARKGIAMYGSNYIQGHVHRANIIRVGNYIGDYIGVESPCLCNMSPEYVKGYAQWQQGWTIGVLTDDGWQIEQVVL